MKQLKLRAFILSMSFVIVFALNGLAFAEPFCAVDTSGAVVERSEPNRGALEEGTYTQVFLSEESGQGCALSGPGIDWYGDYYFVKRNAAGTESYLFKNYSPTNKSTPFITIAGKVGSWEVTSDEDASYFYYKLADKDGMYRLPLKQGATEAEYKEFEFEGSPFLFSSFTLTDKPDQFLLMSSHKDLKVTIGLFSFEGNTTPSATWTCILPKEWESSYEPAITNNLGYSIAFETTTRKIWLSASKTYRSDNSTAYENRNYWFFCREISEQSDLTAYDPVDEISGWNDGNFKSLSIGRYARLILEHSGKDIWSDLKSIREYDPVAKKVGMESLTQWVDLAGNAKPIEYFISSGFWGWTFGYNMDSSKNIYLTSKGVEKDSSSWDAVFQRFALFKPAEGIGKPEPDPSAKNVDFSDPDNVLLKASPFKAPSGYKVTGSRWRIYGNAVQNTARGAQALLHEGVQSGPGDTYKIPTGVLGKGDFEWQMSYDWEYSSAHETMKGATSWSTLAPFTVMKGSSGSSSGGGGGCGTGAFSTALLGLVGITAIRRKRS